MMICDTSVERQEAWWKLEGIGIQLLQAICGCEIIELAKVPSLGVM